MGWDQVGTCGIGALTSDGGRTLPGLGEIREDSLEARVPETRGPGGSGGAGGAGQGLCQPRATPRHSQRTGLGPAQGLPGKSPSLGRRLGLPSALGLCLLKKKKATILLRKIPNTPTEAERRHPAVSQQLPHSHLSTSGRCPGPGPST